MGKEAVDDPIRTRKEVKMMVPFKQRTESVYEFDSASRGCSVLPCVSHIPIADNDDGPLPSFHNCYVPCFVIDEFQRKFEISPMLYIICYERPTQIHSPFRSMTLLS